jgi:hypothetical protein
MKINYSAGLATVVVAVLTGCATGKIEKVDVPLAKDQISKSDPIYIKDFDCSKAVFKGENSDKPDKVAEQRARIPTIISAETIKDLAKDGYTAKNYSAAAPTNAVIVEGEVVLVDAGSGAARFWVGMGAGNSVVKANVKIYRGSDASKPLAELQMSGTSGGAGGFSGYSDWTAKNCVDLAMKLSKYLMGK